MERLLNEANRCLNCKNPMCRNGCPVSTNIPEFIRKIKEKKFEEAYYILQENNFMSEICSLICPTQDQCMGKCIRGIKADPVNINKLEYFVNKWANEHHLKYTINVKKSNGKKVAIIGAGPSGISCAIELKKEGYDVTIFEKEEKIGGILEYQIPDFRLEKETIKPIEKLLKEIGIVVRYNTEFGKDFNIDLLKKEGYNSIFIGIGANTSSKYKLTTKTNKNIFVAKDILTKYYNKEENKLGKTIVIGGGNVAIDAARVANKMGAKTTTIVYRRNKEKMPANKSKIEDAINEGVKFLFNTKVISANVDNDNNIQNIECIKTITQDDKIEDIKDSNFKIEADTIIFAIGLKIEEDLLDKMGIKTENGLIKVDEKGMTNIKNVFAGGDLVEKKQTVCQAIASGKRAAKGIINA